MPHLLERRGAIVQLSSTAGRVARLGNAAYAASKFAVNAFSESLRQEVTTRGVRVIVLEPGVVETELREHIAQPAARERIEAAATAIRQLQPEDIAAAVCYALRQPERVAVNEVLIRPSTRAGDQTAQKRRSARRFTTEWESPGLPGCDRCRMELVPVPLFGAGVILRSGWHMKRAKASQMRRASHARRDC